MVELERVLQARNLSPPSNNPIGRRGGAALGRDTREFVVFGNPLGGDSKPSIRGLLYIFLKSETRCLRMSQGCRGGNTLTKRRQPQPPCSRPVSSVSVSW